MLEKRINKADLYETDINMTSRRTIKGVWTDTKIEHNCDITKKSKRCVITIPVYKIHLSDLEADSLRQVVKILGDKFELVLFCPFSLNTKIYDDAANYKFSVLRCSDEFFRSQRSYSDLCERWEFYDALSDYEYMLIYQLDAWIFEDKIDYFVDMGYDYIGGLHLVGFRGHKDGENGNGGFSLRKVKTFINVCKKTDFSQFRALEDCVFTQDLKGYFKLAPTNICKQFSFQDTPSMFYKQNGDKLPMGCHAFRRFNWQFWKQFIKPEKYNDTPTVKIKYIEPKRLQEKTIQNKMVDGLYGQENAIDRIKKRREITLTKRGPVRKIK